MNHQKIERQADEAYAEFMRQWSRAIRADAGEPTHVEVWHHAWRAALAAAPAQPVAVPAEPVAQVTVSDDDLDMGFSESFISGEIRLPNGTHGLFTAGQMLAYVAADRAARGTAQAANVAGLAAAPVQPAIPPDSRELELAAPAQDARKPLTDAQIDAATLEVIGIFALDIETNQTARMIARTIEAAHGIT